jgi:hypothetical protein
LSTWTTVRKKQARDRKRRRWGGLLYVYQIEMP